MEVNLEVIINKLEYKVNELTLRNAKLKKLGVIKDRLEATYRCELRKELLRLSINGTKISIIDDIAQAMHVEKIDSIDEKLSGTISTTVENYSDVFANTASTIQYVQGL